MKHHYGLYTYVDWIDDKQANLPRALEKLMTLIKDENGKPSTATESLKIINDVLGSLYGKNLPEGESRDANISKIIEKRLQTSKLLFYIQSRHYDYSRWMPWELGMADAQTKEIYRVPIQYIKKRKKYGKRHGFLARYASIIDRNGYFRKKAIEHVVGRSLP